MLCLTAILLAACSRPASQRPASLAPTTGTAAHSGPQVLIDQVQVEAGAGIYVQGHSTLADGECVKTELLDAQQPVAWWPKDVCVEVDAGQWELLAALGKDGAPETLNPAGHYTVHAWWPKQPQQSSTNFSIDLAGPSPAH